MSYKSKIEWTETTWNPVTGCSKISEGCQNCYAEKLSKRLKAMGNPSYKNGFNVTLHPDILLKPLLWNKPRMIFVNSMSDLFHENVPEDFIIKVFEIMNRAKQHVFQVLTKRPERLMEINKKVTWTNNIWLGVTIEHTKYLSRTKKLLKTGAKIKFISFEPLLSAIHEIDPNINWVIVGGESGPGARLIKKEWVIEIRDLCEAQRIPFFFKQWGGINKKAAGRLLNGKIYNAIPIIK